jgi:hypothetical protein
LITAATGSRLSANPFYPIYNLQVEIVEEPSSWGAYLISRSLFSKKQGD